MATRGSLQRLQQRLRAIPQAAKAEIRKALAASAEEIVAHAKRLVPVDSGDLRDSIGWTFGAAPKGAMVLATGGEGELKVTVYAGTSDAFYARWVEFGTAAQPAHPYFFPAYRLVRKRVKSRISRAVNKAAKTAAGGG